MPTIAVIDTDVTYHLISFDEKGRERTDDPDGLMSDVITRELASSDVTDVFLISHGWRGDLPAANAQYQRWIRAMFDRAEDRRRIREKRPDFRALLVGVHWPSEPFGEEDFQDVSFDTDTAPPVDVEAQVTKWAERLGTGVDGTAALHTILTSAAEDPIPPALPDDVREAYLSLNLALGLGTDGVGAAPDADRESFDPDAAYLAALDEEVDFGGGFSFGDLLTPLKQLSFWTMKARARTVGENGGHEFLRALQHVPRPAGREDVRFHMIGHSFGCIVVTAMVAGPPGGSGPVRPVSSMALVQGAVSLWSYCSTIPDVGGPGYFHPLIERDDVSGPVLTTRSVHDKAVGFWYPKAAGLHGAPDFLAVLPRVGGLGAFGIQGPGPKLNDLDMGDENAVYDFRPGQVYNLMADGTIFGGDFFSGAHSQITGSAVAHSVWVGVIAAP